MIPKKIHYCWFGGKEMPEILKKCIQTWKEFCSDYEIIEWNESNFDINSVDFVKEALIEKKYAFASDYVRLHALYTQGGIYFDTDVVLKTGLDKFLAYGFFTSVENAETPKKNPNKIYIFDDGTTIQIIGGLGFLAAVMGSKPNHPFLKDCLDWYENKHFILPDGKFVDFILSPDIYASIASQKYGFRYKDEKQELPENMTIFDSEVFATNVTKATKNSVAIHIGCGSWRDKTFFGKLKKNPLLKAIIKNNFFRRMFRKGKFIEQDLFDYAQSI
jgi:mannosyltransferase OCH1-like enzyme